MECFLRKLRGWTGRDRCPNGDYFSMSILKTRLSYSNYSGIPPGGNFTYVVPIDVDGQWGTYWVHSHSSVGPRNVLFVLKVLNLLNQGQYVDGLRAPLIIHPPKEVHKYDEEFTVVITDWYHTEHDVLVKQFISPSNPTELVPIPGLFPCSFASQQLI